MGLIKKDTDESVMQAGLRRMEYLYKKFDKIIVCFSGGKDSTCVLNLALIVATKLNKLPVHAVFWDEEAIQPETVDYVNRVRQIPDIKLRWMCLPVNHRNACSRKQPFWHPWWDKERHLWVRELPPWAEHELPGFNFHKIPDTNHLLEPNPKGTVCFCTGVRADESLMRYRGVTWKVEDNYITTISVADHGDAKVQRSTPHLFMAKPIYDWTTDDVWRAPHEYGWDYNRSYDIMLKAGISKCQQRVAPPFGEEPIENLWMWKTCWPETWEKMVARVPGAATAARYSCTLLYSYGAKVEKPPEGHTWQTYIDYLLSKFGPKESKFIAGRLRAEMERHNKASGGDPIPDNDPHPKSGLSWQFLAMLATRGDFKGRKSAVANIPMTRGGVSKSKQMADKRKEKEKEKEKAEAGGEIAFEGNVSKKARIQIDDEGGTRF